MKIGFFTDTYFPQINGVTYTIDLWKRELERRGHEVYVYYPRSKEYTPRKNEIPLFSVPIPFYKGYRLAIPAKKEIELDLVHIHGIFSTALHGLAVARKQGIPSVLTYHTPPDLYIAHVSSDIVVQDALKVLYLVYEKELLSRCDMITAPSGVIKRWLETKTDRVCRILSNGIDTNFFKKADVKCFKKRHNIPAGRLIGFTGRHSYEKHLEELIWLADKFDGTILIAGDGPERKYYEGMAKGRRNVRFLGFLPREELPQFYSCLDVFCFPSRAETQGLVALEANACGTPVVAADALALSETVKDGINGFKYKPGNPDDFLAKIKLVYESGERLRTSSKKAARKENVENTIKHLLCLYNELINNEGMSISRGR